MSSSLSLTAHAKINLHLEVGKKRDDGFHEIVSLMQEISISDEILVHLSDSDKCNLQVLGCEVGEENTIVKAYRAFQKITGIRFGIDVFLLKRIPIGAGLGGASSDAASLIVAMDWLLGTRLEHKTKIEIACMVGSDVPFFLSGGSACVRGRGEIVERIRLHGAYVGILIYPDFPSFTKEAYEMIDGKCGISKGESIELTTFHLFETQFFNHFELPLFLRYPKLKEIKEDFLNSGCDFALMSGAGSAVYGLYRSCAKAKIAQDYLSKKWKNCAFFIPIEK